MVTNDGGREPSGGRRKPDPITIDLTASSVRLEPNAPAAEAPATPAADDPGPRPGSPERAAQAAESTAGASTADVHAAAEPKAAPAAEPAASRPVFPEFKLPFDLPSGGLAPLLASAAIGGAIVFIGAYTLAGAGLWPDGGIEVTTSRLAEQTARIAALETRLAAVGQATAPASSLAAVEARLKGVETRVSTEIEHLRQIPDTPAGMLSGLQQSLESSVAARVGKLDQDIAARLATMEKATAESTARTDTAIAATANLATTVETLDKRTSSDVAVLRSEVQAAGAANEARAGEVDSRLKSALAGIEDLKSGLQQQKTALDALSSALADIDKRTAADLAIIRGTASESSAAREKDSADLRQQIGHLQVRLAMLDDIRRAIDGLGAHVGALDEVKKTVDAQTMRMGGIDEARKIAEGVSASLWIVDQRLLNVQARLNEIDTLKASLDGEAKRLGAIDTRIAPVEAKVTSFDAWAKEGVAARQQAIAAIATANLKSAFDSGRPFAGELAAAKPIVKGLADLSALDAFAARGVATDAELLQQFPKVARAILEADTAAPVGSSVLNTLVAHATQAVKIRPAGTEAGDTAEARLSRIEGRLSAHDLAGALNEWQSLPDAARQVSADWAAALKTRVDGARLMAAVTDQVLTKLNAASE